eukprot:scaffold1678_cov80-Cylindrotheca_fusiformis.AAC.8
MKIHDQDDPANGAISYAKGMVCGRVIEGVLVYSSTYELFRLGWLFKPTEVACIEDCGALIGGYGVFVRGIEIRATTGSAIQQLTGRSSENIMVRET